VHADGGRSALQLACRTRAQSLGVRLDARVIDIERVRTGSDCDAISARLFAPGEQARLAALAPADRTDAFFACWTRKEAVLKAVGLGISRGLGHVEVTCQPGGPARVVRSSLAEVDPAGWALLDLAAPAGYRSALAVSMAEPRVSHIGEALGVVLSP
jgi:4'-phosphopantetheinyl transferase